MRVRKISAFIMVFLLVLSSLTLFSFAADTKSVKDSGSPEVSLMALRSIAADDGISLAAAEGDSGQFGYNIEPYSQPDAIQFLEYSNRYQVNFIYYSLPVGEYSFFSSFNIAPSSIGGYSNGSVPGSSSVDGLSASFSFINSSVRNVTVLVTFPLSSVSSVDDISVSEFSFSRLTPVDGISSGWSVNQSFSETNRRDSSETFTWDFGNQPAGNYLLNAYHYGIAYDVDWNICYGSSIVGTDSRFIPVTNSDGVSTALVSHGGGDLILSGTVTFSHSYGDGFFDGSGSYSEYNGSGSFSVDIFQSDNWSYAVSDVVIIPLESAGLEQFGIFGSIVGFFRDQFSDMKSWIAVQIDKIAGDDETKTDVDDAQSELQKEVEDLNNLSGQLDTHASNLEQQFTTDFAIPDTVSGQGTNFQSIYTSLFGSLGVFGIFIWLPIVMAVIKKLLRL